jgi:hypothetical protein
MRAGLCLDAADEFARWPDDSAPGAVLDLSCWNDDRLPLLAGHAEECGTPLAERPLLPARTPGVWLTMLEAKRWPAPDAGVLSPALATNACGVEFLPEDPQSEGRAGTLNT